MCGMEPLSWLGWSLTVALRFCRQKQTQKVACLKREFTGQLLQRVKFVKSVGSGSGVYDIAWSSSPLVACACADGTVYLYHAGAAAEEVTEVTEVAKEQLSDCILTHVCWGAGEARSLL